MDSMQNDEPTDASVGYGLARLGRGIAWAGFWVALGWAMAARGGLP